MENSISINNNDLFDYNNIFNDNNVSHYSNFNYSKLNNIYNITHKSLSNSKKEKQKKKIINININTIKSKSLDKIDKRFNFSFSRRINEDNDYSYFNEESLSSIPIENDDCLEKSFEMDDFLKKSSKYKYLIENDVFQRCTYLYNIYIKIKENTFFSKMNIRCFLKEKCDCIPLIQNKGVGLLFICNKNKKLEKYLDIEVLLKMILDGNTH